MKLEAVRKIALTLPEATEAPHFHYTSFRVRGKILPPRLRRATSCTALLANAWRRKAPKGLVPA